MSKPKFELNRKVEFNTQPLTVEFLEGLGEISPSTKKALTPTLEVSDRRKHKGQWEYYLIPFGGWVHEDFLQYTT